MTKPTQDPYSGGLDDLELDDTSTMTLTTPKGDTLQGPTGKLNGAGFPARADVVFTLKRMACREVQTYIRRNQTKRINASLRKGGKKKANVEEQHDEATALLVLCTVGWTNMVLGKKPYPCTPENVEALYTNAKFSWIRDQVDEFIGDAAEFLKNS